jgi:hypothetical protein
MSKKIIKFALEPSVYDINVPLPSKNYIPDWYKDTPRFYNTNKQNIIDHGKTFKVCMPFTDSIISGYIFELWQDIYVVGDEDFPRIGWRDEKAPVFATREREQSGHMSTPAGYHDIHYVLRHPLYIQTPPGYSILVTQPFNRFDLPFMALTGIVDSDKEPFFPGNYSMFLKQGFSGEVKSGTPLLQIIPFKRDEWKSETDWSLVEKGNRASNKSIRKMIGWYRDNVWSKKSYE